MKLTLAAKQWLIGNMGVKSDATDAEFLTAWQKAIAENKISAEKQTELQKPETPSIADMIGEQFRSAFGPIGTQLTGIAQTQATQGQALTTLGTTVAELQRQVNGQGAGAGTPAATGAAATGQAGSEGASAVDALLRAASGASAGLAVSDPGANGAPAGTRAANVGAAVTGAGAGGNVRVIPATERYATNRSDIFYPDDHKHFPGMPVVNNGRTLQRSSPLDLAISGAWFKMCVEVGGGRFHGIPKGLRMTEHDRELVQYAMHHCDFTGIINGEGSDSPNAHKIDNVKLSEMHRKMLLDDVQSGGLEIAPVVFDDAIITYPLLYGELFPLVNTVNISRGRRIEGGIISTPSFTSGVPEGTPIVPFDTTSFIAAFDTTIYTAVGAMEMGMDFEEDSPINVGGIVVQKYGEKAMQWLDEQIAIGDGVVEPEGIANASGIGDVAMSNAAPTVSQYESLLFGIAKQYRDAATRKRQVFIGNETSYRRSRAISVSTTDARRIFGMNHEEYSLLGHDYKIVQAMANTVVLFGNLSKYRMYRRLGLNVRVERGGKELSLKNLLLLILRMRYGGQIEDAGAFVMADDAQA